MPDFNLTDKELEAIVEFFKYTSQIDTLDWPPNKEG
jgi:nitric oxide reductase subunit C